MSRVLPLLLLGRGMVGWRSVGRAWDRLARFWMRGALDVCNGLFDLLRKRWGWPV